MSRRARLNVVWAERTALRRLDPACFDAVARVREQQAVSPVLRMEGHRHSSPCVRTQSSTSDSLNFQRRQILCAGSPRCSIQR